MPAQWTTPWLVLAGCCCLFMSARAIRVPGPWRGESSSNISKSTFGKDAREDFTLSKMVFTYTDPDPSVTHTTLKMCSDTALSDGPSNTVVTVVFGAPEKPVYSVEGALVDGNNCAEFGMAYRVPDGTGPTTYTLVVNEGTLKTSTAAFVMTVDVAVLSCGPRDLSRVTWDVGTTIVGGCMTYDDAILVCYKEEDLTDQEVCFKTEGNEDMDVCRRGGVVVPGEPSQISVNYLAYDLANPDSARLSLLFNDDSGQSLEVTLWKGSDAPSVLWCDGACALPSFVASNAVYEMCAFLKEGVPEGPQSGFASIQDLKLVAYDMKEEPLFIEYGFVNSNNDSRMYIASLFTVPSPGTPIATVHHDCAGVALGHTCIGFIVPTGLTSSENTYVSVQYTDAAFENPTNRIASKVQLLPAVRRNLSSLRGPV